MKKIKNSYKFIFCFEIITFILLIYNSFKSNILGMYTLPVELVILNFIFVLRLGKEKDNKRHLGEVIYYIVMYVVFFLLLYYLLGLLITFSRTDNYRSLYSLTVIVIPLVLTIILKEYLRNLLLTKIDENKFLLVLTVLLYITIDIITPLSIINYNNSYDLLVFVSLTVLPSITTNIFLTYIVKKNNYLPAVIYLLIINLYQYLMPIVPNPTEYVKSIIDFLFPIIMLIRMIKYYKVPHDEEVYKNKKTNNIIEIALTSVLVMTLVYFVSGYFKYYAIAVASGSMNPEFDRGTVVIVERLDKKYNNYNKLEKGQVIAFKSNGIVVVHRINKSVKIDNVTYYYTKGDANNNIDDTVITDNNIIGIVRFKIPFIGYPTVWFSEL